MSPTARCLLHYRKQGFIAYTVEKWIPQVKRRIDAFGFGDILIAKQGWGIGLVQATSRSGGNYSAHRQKIVSSPLLPAWKAAGGRVLLTAWGLRGPKGKRKTYQIREEEL